ncbi:hypothetical protein DR64_7835 [Paraburkholderia xenovorans LB400]|nr:hypothetical protein DR64_7835 [Paraburkholderia xenovorans LB400]
MTMAGLSFSGVLSDRKKLKSRFSTCQNQTVTDTGTIVHR